MLRNFSSDPPAALVPPQGNKTGRWTRSSSVPIPSSPAQQPTWRRMSSTSSCWSEGLACWPVLTFSPFSFSRNILILLLIPSKLTSGLESPTHALRADADPSAQSASATYITLAQEHPYDRHIEIILHLSGEQLGTSPSFISANLISLILYYYPQKLTAHWSYWREAGSPLASMKSRSPPAEISSAALEKIWSPKGRLVLTCVSFTRCLQQSPV